MTVITKQLSGIKSTALSNYKNVNKMNEITNTTEPQIAYSECYAQGFLGDCLEQHEHIKSGSVDLILTDLPYGNMKGINNPERPKSWGNKEYLKWDDDIEPKSIYEIANRILRNHFLYTLLATVII